MLLESRWLSLTLNLFRLIFFTEEVLRGELLEFSIDIKSSLFELFSFDLIEIKVDTTVFIRLIVDFLGHLAAELFVTLDNIFPFSISVILSAD